MNEESNSRIYPLLHPRETNPQQHEPSNTSTSSNFMPNPLQNPAPNTSTSSSPMTTPIPTDNTPVHNHSGSLCGPANATWQTNILHHPAPNFIPTPIHMDNTPVHSQPGSLDGLANLTMKTNPPLYHRQFYTPDGYSSEESSSSEENSSREESSSRIQPPMYPREKVSVIAIGNPGAGKSTILNYLAGEILFKSGISIGQGLTYQLNARVNDRGRFFDTPGLADDTHREAAANAISTALRKGGPFKILFFVRLDNGRIVREDNTTLKLVLESAPEIGNKYGIVTNKIESEVAELLKDPKEAERLVIKLMASIPEENRCDPRSITYLPYRREAHAKNNHLLHSNSLMTPEGSSFADFVYEEIETVELTQGEAKDIEIENFDATTKRIEALEKKLEENTDMYKEQQRLMEKRMEKADRDKAEQYERFNRQVEMTRIQMEKRNDAGKLQQEQMQLHLDYQIQKFEIERTEQAEFQKQQMGEKDKEMAAARIDALRRERRQEEQLDHQREELNQERKKREENERKKREAKKKKCRVM